MAYIYKLTNIKTGKLYIGKTEKTITERYDVHVVNSKILDTYLYRSMRKHGVTAFVVDIVEPVNDVNTLDARERHWIQTLNTLAPAGYNMTAGGEGGDTSRSPNYIEGMKHRNFSGENNPNYGKLGTASPNYGSIRTVEQKENLRRGLTAAWRENTTRKELLSARMSGKNNPSYGQIPANALTVVFDGKMYDSLADASRITGRSPPYIKKYGKIIKNDKQ